MEYKFNYKNEKEKEKILEENEDKQLVSINELFSEKYIIFKDVE